MADRASVRSVRTVAGRGFVLRVGRLRVHAIAANPLSRLELSAVLSLRFASLTFTLLFLLFSIKWLPPAGTPPWGRWWERAA